MRRSATIVDAPIPDITAWNDEEFAQAYDRPAYFCVVAGIPHFRRGNPQNLPEVVFEELWLERELGGYDFVCAHRDDAGYVRECACWAAMNAGRRGRDGVPV